MAETLRPQVGKPAESADQQAEFRHLNAELNRVKDIELIAIAIERLSDGDQPVRASLDDL